MTTMDKLNAVTRTYNGALRATFDLDEESIAAITPERVIELCETKGIDATEFMLDVMAKVKATGALEDA